MELLLMALIIVLGVAVLLQAARSGELQSENYHLRRENRELREEAMAANTGGGGCGALLGLLLGVGGLLVIMYALVVYLG